MKENIFSRCLYNIWLAWRRIILRPVLSVLLILLVLFIIASIIIMVSENIGYGEAVLKLFPAFLGDLGEIGDPNLLGQICRLIGMLASISFLVILTAKITSLLLEFIKRGGSMVKKVKYSGHTIICGWNFQGEQIVRNLLESQKKKQRKIVVLANQDERPLKDERAEFIKGDPTNDEDLINAGIKTAENVIILADYSLGITNADSNAVLIALAAESINPKVHSCVQIMRSENAIHLKHAHVDEIICLDQVGGSLAASSAISHGLSLVLTEMLTFNKGTEIYRYQTDLSDELNGREYVNVAQSIIGKHMILLGVETDYDELFKQKGLKDIFHVLKEENRVIVVNPQSEYLLRRGDVLFIASESEPSGL